MKLVISHPTGNQNVRAAAMGLAEAGMVSVFNTTIATFPGDITDRLSNFPPLSSLSRRRYDARIKHVTQTWPWLETGRLIALKAGLSRLTRHEHGPFSVDAIYRNLDKRVARALKSQASDRATAIYAYEDGALHSFREARHLGLRCLYDLPIGYWRAAERLLAVEMDRWPDWATTMTGLYNSPEKLARKDEELSLAHEIFVASQFTAKTLQDAPGRIGPVHVIPYGFPPAVERRDYDTRFNKPLKILFVGGLSQRKGIAYLFTVAEALGRHVELTVVGSKTINNCPALDRALARHRWFPTLAHRDVLALMKTQDVLVFPSLFEGFGLVITEAMSQGTPVITTERTAGPDLIVNGQNGWLVNAGSSDSLMEAIEKMLSNRLMIRRAGEEALITARQRPWAVYGRELSDSVRLALKGSEKRGAEMISDINHG